MACENWNQHVTTEDELGKREEQDKDELIHLVLAEKKKRKRDFNGPQHLIKFECDLKNRIAFHPSLVVMLILEVRRVRGSDGTPASTPDASDADACL